jgi:hypothetical protein
LGLLCRPRDDGIIVSGVVRAYVLAADERPEQVHVMLSGDGQGAGGLQLAVFQLVDWCFQLHHVAPCVREVCR